MSKCVRSISSCSETCQVCSLSRVEGVTMKALREAWRLLQKGCLTAGRGPTTQTTEWSTGGSCYNCSLAGRDHAWHLLTGWTDRLNGCIKMAAFLTRKHQNHQDDFWNYWCPEPPSDVLSQSLQGLESGKCAPDEGSPVAPDAKPCSKESWLLLHL